MFDAVQCVSQYSRYKEIYKCMDEITGIISRLKVSFCLHTHKSHSKVHSLFKYVLQMMKYI